MPFFHITRSPYPSIFHLTRSPYPSIFYPSIFYPDHPVPQFFFPPHPIITLSLNPSIFFFDSFSILALALLLHFPPEFFFRPSRLKVFFRFFSYTFFFTICNPCTFFRRFPPMVSLSHSSPSASLQIQAKPSQAKPFTSSNTPTPKLLTAVKSCEAGYKHTHPM